MSLCSVRGPLSGVADNHVGAESAVRGPGGPAGYRDVRKLGGGRDPLHLRQAPQRPPQAEVDLLADTEQSVGSSGRSSSAYFASKVRVTDHNEPRVGREFHQQSLRVRPPRTPRGQRSHPCLAGSYRPSTSSLREWNSNAQHLCKRSGGLGKAGKAMSRSRLSKWTGWPESRKSYADRDVSGGLRDDSREDRRVG